MTQMTPEEAEKILGPFAKHVDIGASIVAQDPEDDSENWLKTQGWNMAPTGEMLFDNLELWSASRAEQRAVMDQLYISGRLAHAPKAVKDFLDARGLLPEGLT